ncbi:radical SAM family heme chaperone HemW [Metabacillus idriensis]|uniref:Heme chaperone HemW n=1 Tax=Metabacillus idriensis TaxID=324768 RepID=A0A6I2MJD8_9BACI|nr:radical SAM family heme chaperone HemW [Metabacillus idriensis]MCM3596293.1 radical SAM family heme chaperone HemW [Metabacillus idriensis]MRX55943.1 oxygen-independent coproporphyrinogen III oxidase [Metabacillus idriensis]OHR74044.1 coproporphyrinogen III oxidase [Bacillus sp. HMSC76G11]
MVKAAYLHIPFCEQICHYCDFNKVFLKNQPVDEYLDSMQMEMKNTLIKYPSDSLETIFIGGGTPTALNEKQMEKLLIAINEEFKPSPSLHEFAVEANPGDLSYEKLKVMKDLGVNRLSFGVQTFNDSLLEKIGRTHRSADVMKSIELAKKAGFDNISIDLMYGLPGQTIHDFRDSLKIAFGLDVQHYSSYSLIVEPKTVFYNLMSKGRLILPPQEDEAVMYEYLMEEMEQHGFHQYEISNFALPGYESRHNLTYWNNEEYYGIGAGAHSYTGNIRRANAGPLKKYMQLIEETGFPYLNEHQVTEAEKMEEELFLGLRKSAGVSKKRFADKFGVPIANVFGLQIREQTEKGLLNDGQDSISLTHQGKLLGNEVFQAFLGVVPAE